MKPRFRPLLEAVEAKVLPAGAVALALSTDRPAYAPGETVHMTLTVTDTSGHDVSFGDGPSLDGFYATEGGTTVWRSNDGPQPLFLRLVTLHPGESYTLKADWDGRPNQPGSPAVGGVVGLHNQLSVDGATAPPLTVSVGQPLPVPLPAPSPTPSPVPVTSPPLVLSVSPDHTVRRVGQAVTFSVTETNTSNHDVTVTTGGRILSASVSGPGGTVWNYRDARALATGRTVLHAGQSRALTVTWSGRPNARGARVVPGLYAAHVGLDGAVGSVAFRLSR